MANGFLKRNQDDSDYELVDLPISPQNLISVTGIPDADDGNEGDYALQLDARTGSNNVWGPKAAGAWPPQADFISANFADRWMPVASTELNLANIGSELRANLTPTTANGDITLRALVGADVGKTLLVNNFSGSTKILVPGVPAQDYLGNAIARFEIKNNGIFQGHIFNDGGTPTLKQFPPLEVINLAEVVTESDVTEADIPQLAVDNGVDFNALFVASAGYTAIASDTIRQITGTLRLDINGLNIDLAINLTDGGNIAEYAIATDGTTAIGTAVSGIESTSLVDGQNLSTALVDDGPYYVLARAKLADGALQVKVSEIDPGTDYYKGANYSATIVAGAQIKTLDGQWGSTAETAGGPSIVEAVDADNVLDYRTADGSTKINRAVSSGVYTYPIEADRKTNETLFIQGAIATAPGQGFTIDGTSYPLSQTEEIVIAKRWDGSEWRDVGSKELVKGDFAAPSLNEWASTQSVVNHVTEQFDKRGLVMTFTSSDLSKYGTNPGLKLFARSSVDQLTYRITVGQATNMTVDLANNPQWKLDTWLGQGVGAIKSHVGIPLVAGDETATFTLDFDGDELRHLFAINSTGPQDFNITLNADPNWNEDIPQKEGIVRMDHNGSGTLVINFSGNYSDPLVIDFAEEQSPAFVYLQANRNQFPVSLTRSPALVASNTEYILAEWPDTTAYRIRQNADGEHISKLGVGKWLIKSAADTGPDPDAYYWLIDIEDSATENVRVCRAESHRAQASDTWPNNLSSVGQLLAKLTAIGPRESFAAVDWSAFSFEYTQESFQSPASAAINRSTESTIDVSELTLNPGYWLVFVYISVTGTQDHDPMPYLKEKGFDNYFLSGNGVYRGESLSQIAQTRHFKPAVPVLLTAQTTLVSGLSWGDNDSDSQTILAGARIVARRL